MIFSNEFIITTGLNIEVFWALPQIEWVNIFIEPANTPLSVIPAEAGIQCLLAPGRWIPAKNVQE